MFDAAAMSESFLVWTVFVSLRKREDSTAATVAAAKIIALRKEGIQSYKYKATGAAAGDKLSRRQSVGRGSTGRERERERGDLDANPQLFVCNSFEKLGHALEDGFGMRPASHTNIEESKFIWNQNLHFLLELVEFLIS